MGIAAFIFQPRVRESGRLDLLDGWRGISIVAVLAAHMLPLGPKSWQLNSTAGPLGMAVFFTLSGFLITSFLIHRPSVSDFLVRRLARILPLAWLTACIALVWVDASPSMWAANLLFYANWPPMQLAEVLSPFWSLCVEMQFYLGAALIFLVAKERGLRLLPFFCVAVTLYRVISEAPIAINTYYRVDEILAGCWLALAYNGYFGECGRRVIGALNPFVLAALFVVSCHPESGFMNYLRPYLAALLVGWTLTNPVAMLSKPLLSSTLSYIAAVSYSLYLIHPLLIHSWLGSGDTLEKYAKRPLLFLVLFALAHLSTFYYERWFTDWAKGRKQKAQVGHV